MIIIIIIILNMLSKQCFRQSKKFTKRFKIVKKLITQSLLDPCIKSGGGRPVDDWITFSKSYGF